MLPNNVKMVIWDLDDTFWSGTLAEGAITPVQANIDIVIALAERGIISSICSKNDHVAAQAALTGLGVWNYFVFPRIEFGPKGQNVADIIETAGLRAENILFIDDNILNLEEARHVSPGLMTADPLDILPVLLDLPQLAGKDDRALTRLQQYRNLEVKAAERAVTTLGNEDFLRGCGITVDIDYEVESQFDRIVELANRTNQLNYTKQRLETPEAVDAFRKLLTTYGVTAGLVRVADKYGDYGIVGFFVLHRIAARNDLLHFVFSCRTMNMGIEQYIFERLQKPRLTIVPPVANPVSTFSTVDWITEGTAGAAHFAAATSSKKLLLLGGCELLQLASLCSSNREEFVNTVRQGWGVRFDDPGFILGDRRKIQNDKSLVKLKYWTYEDVERFDAALAVSEILIVALFSAATKNYYASAIGNVVRIADGTLNRHLRNNLSWFEGHFHNLKLSFGARLELIAKSLDKLARNAAPGAVCFALGVNTKKTAGASNLAACNWLAQLGPQAQLQDLIKSTKRLQPVDRPTANRHIFNHFLKDYCSKSASYRFVDIDALTQPNDIHDPEPGAGKFYPDHLTRRGYINVAAHIAEQLAGAQTNSVIVEAA